MRTMGRMVAEHIGATRNAAPARRTRGGDAWLALAAANGFLAVAAGAFAAHLLASRLAPDALAIFQTAARYHMYHALALGLVATRRHACGDLPTRLAASCFLIGMLLFSGSLYAFALTDRSWLAAIAPVGGGALLLGWAALAWSAIRPPAPPAS